MLRFTWVLSFLFLNLACTKDSAGTADGAEQADDDSGARAGDDNGTRADDDGGSEHDGAEPDNPEDNDGPFIDGGGCEVREQEFKQFLKANLECDDDADCTVIGDCGPNADFEAIRADAEEEGYELMQATCHQSYDGPTYDAVCKAGKCELQDEPNGCCGCPYRPGDAGIDGGVSAGDAG